MGETAVIVNELGDIGIDHHLLSRVDERTVLLASGCLCCTLRGDLADELRDLLGRRDAGEIPPFNRVVVETTGLADPTPIVYTLLTEPVVRHHFELDGVVATVDAQHGLRGPESVKQAAVADVLVVTKTDLADAARSTTELARLNPAGEVVAAVLGDVEPRGSSFGRARADDARFRARRRPSATRTRTATRRTSARWRSSSTGRSTGSASASGSRCCSTRTARTCCV